MRRVVVLVLMAAVWPLVGSTSVAVATDTSIAGRWDGDWPSGPRSVEVRLDVTDPNALVGVVLIGTGPCGDDISGMTIWKIASGWSGQLHIWIGVGTDHCIAAGFFDARWVLEADGRLRVITIELPPDIPPIPDVLVSREGDASYYVALGDSYASGEGSDSYVPGTDTPTNHCHRATNGYSQQIATWLGLTSTLAACSGAFQRDLYTSSDKNLGEIPQLLHLGAATRLVTLTIGGDDVGFSGVLTDCVHGADFLGYHPPGATGCSRPKRSGRLATKALEWLRVGRPETCVGQTCIGSCYTLPGIDKNGNRNESCGAMKSLTQVYEGVLTEAPNATLIVVGYPRLFFDPPTNGCTVGTAAGIYELHISSEDVFWLNEQADALDEVFRQAVLAASAAKGRTVRYYDPRHDFAGHAICDTEKTVWLNGLQFHGRKPKPKAESFHPNKTGQNKYVKPIEALTSQPTVL